MDPRVLALMLLALISAFFIYSFLAQPQDGPETGYTEFIKDLSSAAKVYIISDLRNSSSPARVPIMQCGIDLAGSVPLAPKNVSYFVIEGSTCIGGKGNMSASYCEELSRSGATFYIKYGNSTKFYRNRMIIGIQGNYSSQCSVTQKNVSVS